jgi:hypothetical protein
MFEERWTCLAGGDSRAQGVNPRLAPQAGERLEAINEVGVRVDD